MIKKLGKGVINPKLTWQELGNGATSFRGRFWWGPDNPLFFRGNLDSLVRA